MNIEHALWLTTFLACAAGTNAQTCSGGPAGGLDAAGCQCSTAEADGDAIDSRTWEQLSARLVTRSPAVAAIVAPTAASIDAAGMPAGSTSVAGNSLAAGVDPVGPAVHGCSGGIDGGTDVNGNECSAMDNDARELDMAARARLFDRLVEIRSNGASAPLMMPAKLQQ